MANLLAGISRGRFVEMMLADVSDCESVYLEPVCLNTEQDVKSALRPFYDGRLGFDVEVGLLSGLCSSIGEVLMNACMHADARGSIVFVGDYCKHKSTLDISVYDRGVGFRPRISSFLNRPCMTAREAINWALGEGHSVDVNRRAAGIGLNETVDFMRRNGGLMEIASGDAIWCMSGGQPSMTELGGEIVGSLVNFSIIMDSSVSYSKRIDAEVSQVRLEVEKNEA